MTPEQKERIRQAAQELSAALTEADGNFEVEMRRIERHLIDREAPRPAYQIRVTAHKKEVIA